MAETEVIAEPGRQDIVTRRLFDAPRAVVFKAFTDPDLIARWWGPRQYETVVDRLEPHAGGTWRYVNSDAGGEYAFHGVFHDVSAPERIVQTFEFEGAPGHVALETATFEETPDGKTRFVGVALHESVEGRDAVLRSGMEAGMRETYERLDEVLASLT